MLFASKASFLLKQDVGNNRTRVIKSVIPGASFFNFFSPPELPTEEEDIGEDEAADLESILQADYQLGDDFKEKIIPNAIHWFTGEALQYEESESDALDAYELEGEDDEETDSSED
jgi:nucleosome assembly protein 1-like 1